MVPTAWIYSIQLGFCSPQLHEHLHPHSTYYLCTINILFHIITFRTGSRMMAYQELEVTVSFPCSLVSYSTLAQFYWLLLHLIILCDSLMWYTHTNTVLLFIFQVSLSWLVVSPFSSNTRFTVHPFKIDQNFAYLLSTVPPCFPCMFTVSDYTSVFIIVYCLIWLASCGVECVFYDLLLMLSL